MVTLDELCTNPQVGDWIVNNFDGYENLSGNYLWTVVSTEPWKMTLYCLHDKKELPYDHPKVIWTLILRRHKSVIAWGRGDEVCNPCNVHHTTGAK